MDIDKERAAFEAWAKVYFDTIKLYRRTEGENACNYTNGMIQCVWDGWQARASVSQDTAPPAAVPAPDAWHTAVLAECMRIEAAYDCNDPAKTLAALIDWHVQQTNEVHETNKVLADHYLKLTCGQGAAPAQAVDASEVARKARNQVVIDGHLNAALDGIKNSDSPDGKFCILGALVDQAIRAALTQQKGASA